MEQAELAKQAAAAEQARAVAEAIEQARRDEALRLQEEMAKVERMRSQMVHTHLHPMHAILIQRRPQATNPCQLPEPEPCVNDSGGEAAFT